MSVAEEEVILGLPFLVFFFGDLFEGEGSVDIFHVVFVDGEFIVFS